MKFILPAVLLSLLLLSITLNEVSGKELKCYTRYMDDDPRNSDVEEICKGIDVVCVTAVNNNDNTIEFKSCGERDYLEKHCEEVSEVMEEVKCNDPCDTDLCNNEK